MTNTSHPKLLSFYGGFPSVFTSSAGKKAKKHLASLTSCMTQHVPLFLIHQLHALVAVPLPACMRCKRSDITDPPGDIHDILITQGGMTKLFFSIESPSQFPVILHGRSHYVPLNPSTSSGDRF